MDRELFGCQRQSLSLVGRNISPQRKNWWCRQLRLEGMSTVPPRVSSLYFHVHGEVKLRRGKDIAAHRSRGGTIDLGDLSL